MSGEAQSDAAPSEIVCRIDWTREEIAEFILWQSCGSPPARDLLTRARRKANNSLLGLITLLVLCGGGIVYSLNGAYPIIGFLSGLLAIYLFFALIYAAANSIGSTRKRYERAAAERAKLVSLTDVQIRIAPDGVTTYLEPGPEFEPWSNYAKVEETRLLIVSRSYTGQCGAVPKRCLGPGYDHTFARIMDWFRAGGGGSAAPVFEALKDLDVPCKSCGYNLRGIQKLQCPECGRELDPILL